MVVGCSGVVGVEMVGAWDFGALVGTVSLLLTLIAGDVHLGGDGAVVKIPVSGALLH